MVKTRTTFEGTGWSSSAVAGNLEVELAATKAALARLQKQAALMQDIGRALSSGLPLDALLALIMDKVTLLMRAERATLYLLSDDRQRLWSQVILGDALLDIELVMGEGLAGWVAEHGESINLVDAYRDARFQPAVDLKSGFRTRATLVVPMKNGQGDVIGVLQALNRISDGRNDDSGFSAEDEELFLALATQAAMAIENAKLYQDQVAQHVELEAAHRGLGQLTRELNVLFDVEQALSAATSLDAVLERIVAQSAQVLGAQACHVALLEGGANDVLRVRTVGGPHPVRVAGQILPVDDGLIGWVVSRRESVMVNGPSDDFRHVANLTREFATLPQQLVAVPLIDGDDMLGAFEIVDSVSGSPFDDADLRLLVLLSAQAAKAVALAKSRSQQQSSDRLASIGRMLSGVLHDLKTPMTIISGYAQLMAFSDDAEQRAKYVDLVLRQFDIMSGMTREVLAFARGDADIFIRRVYLHLFMPELVTQLRAAVAGRNVTVELDAGFTGLAYFDEQKILRVVHNLGRNAAQAMRDGGTLRIHTAIEGESFVLSISDNGPGIPAEMQGRLFELFASGRRGGTGLGLAIVKKIVDDHNGTISWSTGPAGTTFRIALPKDRPDYVSEENPAVSRRRSPTLLPD